MIEFKTVFKLTKWKTEKSKTEINERGEKAYLDLPADAA
jgi:hypothetical protein